MSLYEIRASLDTDPNWFVIPSHLEALKNKLDAYLRGEMPSQNPDDPEGNIPTIPPDTCLINFSGVVTKRTGVSAAVCDIVGLCDLDHKTAEIKAAIKNPSFEQVLFNFDSGGGYVVGLPECAALINQLSQAKQVFAYTDVIAASAAYELFSQATACYCSPSSIIGSIGTVGTYTNISEGLKQDGIDVKLITSGKYKALTDPKHAPWTDDEIAYLTQGVLKEANRFKSSVLANRKIKDEYMQGQTFTGVEAVRYNLADGLFNDLDEVITFISQ
jgi:ClpP class serine protease